MATLGGIELDSKQSKTAESWFSKAWKIQSRKLPARHEELLRNKNSLALCLDKNLRETTLKAREMLEEAPACLRREPGK